MAQQSAVKRPTTVTERGPAAPSRPRAKAGKVFDYSKFRQSIRDDKDFGVYLAGYPNKTGILGYVYRLKPVVDNALAGISESTIYKTSNVLEMTQEFIGSKFGRGKYMLRLTDANRPKGESDVCKTWFQVDDPDLVPIYDYRTLKLGDPENQDEIARLLQAGVLIRDAGTGQPRLRLGNDEAAPASLTTSHGQGGVDIFSKDMVSQLLLKVVNAGTQSTTDQFKNTLDLAKLLQVQNSQQPQLSPEQLAELVVAKLERTSTRTNSEGDMFQTYERMEAFIQKVKGPAVAAIPDNLPTSVVVAERILGHLSAIVPMVFQGIQTLQQQRAMQPRPGKRAAAGQQQNAQPEPNIADRIKHIATIGFQKMLQGVNGHDYAAYVCNFEPGGLEVFRLLESQGAGAPAAIMGLAAMDPQLGAFLNGPEKRAQVEEFLSDFISFDSDPLGELTPPPAPEGAAAGTTV